MIIISIRRFINERKFDASYGRQQIGSAKLNGECRLRFSFRNCELLGDLKTTVTFKCHLIATNLLYHVRYWVTGKNLGIKFL